MDVFHLHIIMALLMASSYIATHLITYLSYTIPSSLLKNSPIIINNTLIATRPKQYFWPTLAITLTLSLIVIMLCNLSIQSLLLILFILYLELLSIIDITYLLLPDSLTLSLLWLGLIFNCITEFTPLDSAIYGASLGYCLLRAINTVFFWLTDKQGLGLGDAKLTAAIASWLGLFYLPYLILIAALLAIAFTVIHRSINKELNKPIPLGIFLSIAAIIILIYHQYMNYSS